jgi:plasmid stabilization system protein ParE
MDDIWEFIAQDDIEAATRRDAKLREAFDLLARNPKIGHKRKDLTRNQSCSGRSANI